MGLELASPTRVLSIMAGVSIVGAACNDSTPSTPNGDSALVKAAKAEGTLTTIALPHDWCNYGEAIETFKAKYGLTVQELAPDAGSGDELEAIRASQDGGPPGPDVIDVGLAFGPTAQAEGLLSPYKVATWDSIPADAKSADGYWVGD